MIPLRDNIPYRTFPFVNYGIIAVCTFVFFAQLASGDQNGVGLVEQFGMIPARVTDPDRPIMLPQAEVVQTPQGRAVEYSERPAAPSAVAPWLTILTCIYLNDAIHPGH